MENSVDFSLYLQQIRARLWRILLVALVTIVVAYPLIKMIPSKYVSTATVLFKALQDEETPFPQLGRYDSTRNDYYETQYSLMNSRVVLERAIQDLKLNDSPDWNGGITQSNARNAGLRMGNTLRKLQQGLTISGIRNSQLAAVSYESRSADEASRVANGVARAFIEYSQQRRQQATEDARRWNTRQMEKVKQQLDARKAEIDDFLKKEGLLTFRGVDGFETEELGIVTNRLADATQRRIAAQSRYNAVNRAMGQSLEQAISLPAFSDHAQIQDLRIALIQTRRKLSELSRRYGPKHPKIQEARAEVEAVNRQTGQVLRELAAGAYQEYQTALDDENRYRQLLAQQKQGFSQLAAKRDRYNTLMTGLKKTEELYQSLYQKAHEQALSSSLKDSDVTIYDPAVPSALPAKPNKTMLLIMAVVLALMLYIAWIIVSTALDSRLWRLSQAEKRLGLPGLGELRQFSDTGGREALIRTLLDSPQDLEVVHSIRTRLMLMTPSPRILALVSLEPQEGRSLLASLVARSFSHDRKTLLIDLDYQSDSGLSAALARPDAPGLSDVLRGECSLEHAAIGLGENLAFLPRGRLTDSTQLLLTASPFSRFIGTLPEHYQQVIIDTPALSQARDGQLVGRLADGVLLVLKAGQTRADDLRQALALLRQGACKLVGTVINQVADKDLETQEGLNALNQQLGELIPVRKRS